LLKGACGTLIETRGYYNAWVAILDESGELVTTASLYSIELEEKHKRAEEKLQELYE
jgi:transcriptional accessory protein Tex/SPT6